MKVLVVGSGGREHAICWKLSKSPKVDKIYCAPGNAGIAELAECVDIKAMEFEKLVAFAKENSIDLTVIGMDDPLVGGVVDVFEAEGLRVFGPRKTERLPINRPLPRMLTRHLSCKVLMIISMFAEPSVSWFRCRKRILILYWCSIRLI